MCTGGSSAPGIPGVYGRSNIRDIVASASVTSHAKAHTGAILAGRAPYLIPFQYPPTKHQLTAIPPLPPPPFRFNVRLSQNPPHPLAIISGAAKAQICSTM
mmetsp:Transcript_26790/g.37268  ORF Transcript_26790/g.37268 Transcript_26790/m.37268 type:complete len:101 (-) Transcript_26790:28-330(-)